MHELLVWQHQQGIYVEEAFTNYNDINEDTRIQLELINQTLAELHGKLN
jgi:hypothetical protein